MIYVREQYKKFALFTMIFLLTIFCSSCKVEQDKKVLPNAVYQEEQNEKALPNTVYEDDICKIVAEGFTDSNEPGYSYYLPLTFENKSNEAFIVGVGDGMMNDEQVLIVCIPESGKPEYGYEFVVMPNETLTEIFRVNYAQTSIRDIKKVKTIKANFTLYKIDFSDEILNTADVIINVK